MLNQVIVGHATALDELLELLGMNNGSGTRPLSAEDAVVGERTRSSCPGGLPRACETQPPREGR